MIFAGGAIVTIDDPDTGGSDSGAWRTAIAHTPHLAAQCGNPITRGGNAASAAREGEAGGDPLPAPASPTCWNAV